jgi:hypothetical protein
MFTLPRTYLVAGITGHGKSTLGNVLLNRDASMEGISHPFGTSDGASACTVEFSIQSRGNVTVIDTVGFGDAVISPEHVLDRFRAALNEVGNLVNAVLIVVRAGRFDDAIVKIVKVIQDDILQGICISNSILVVTGQPTIWVTEQIGLNANLAIMVNKCGGRYCGYKLDLDERDADRDRCESNMRRRSTAIVRVVEYIEGFIFNSTFVPIRTNYIHTEEYKRHWFEVVIGKVAKAVDDLIKVAVAPIVAVFDTISRCSIM